MVLPPYSYDGSATLVAVDLPLSPNQLLQAGWPPT